MNDLIKLDLNFMDKFLWMPCVKSNEDLKENFVMVKTKDRKMFKYKIGHKVPMKFDIMILLFLLLESQRNGYQRKVKITRYRLLKECGYETSATYYKRLKDCFERWKGITLQFEGTFYDGKDYKYMIFGIIDTAYLDNNSQELCVEFNEKFLKAVEESKFCKYVPFKFYKAIQRPVSHRLFDIIVPKLEYQKSWTIGLTNLAQKIQLRGKKVIKANGDYYIKYYPSFVLKTIVPCINELNKLLGDRAKLEQLGFKKQKPFVIEYEVFKNKNGEKCIKFIKKEVQEEKLVGPAKEEIPEDVLEVFDYEYIRDKWIEAINWLRRLDRFNRKRIEDVKQFPKHVVAIIFDKVKEKYEAGKIRTVKGIYAAFKNGWYYKEILEEEKAKKQLQSPPQLFPDNLDEEEITVTYKPIQSETIVIETDEDVLSPIPQEQKEEEPPAPQQEEEQKSRIFDLKKFLINQKYTNLYKKKKKQM